MQRQSKEESIVLWEIERQGMHKDNDKDIERKNLVNALDKVINSYAVTYDEYRNDVIDYFLTLEDTEDLEKRKQQIKDMFVYLTNKYNKLHEDKRFEE